MSLQQAQLRPDSELWALPESLGVPGSCALLGEAAGQEGRWAFLLLRDLIGGPGFTVQIEHV